jgi:predicted negative regulator of RcsB-dependent stress response
VSLEAWKTFFEIGGVILLFLTFVFGAGVLFTSTRINERQAKQLRQFDSDLTQARTALSVQEERAAKAEA